MNGRSDADSIDLLVLGLGNVLCGDDGLGIEAVRRLVEEYQMPEGVHLLDGGTLGLSLLGHLAEARRVLLVDALYGAAQDGETEAAPGTFLRLEGAAVSSAVRERLSVHQVGVADLLDGLHLIGAYPPTLVLLGLVPAEMALHLGLSEPVAAGLPVLVEAVVKEMAALGFPPIPKGREVPHDPPQPWPAAAAATAMDSDAADFRL